MVADIKDFYHNTPVELYKYMQLPLSIIPNKIAKQYSLKDLVTPDGRVYIKIWKGMYNLKQVGLNANIRLTAHLAKYGCTPTPQLTTSRSALSYVCVTLVSSTLASTI
jgi:hypothetical protein